MNHMLWQTWLKVLAVIAARCALFALVVRASYCPSSPLSATLVCVFGVQGPPVCDGVWLGWSSFQSWARRDLSCWMLFVNFATDEQPSFFQDAYFAGLPANGS